jgi:hypothetical protein
MEEQDDELNWLRAFAIGFLVIYFVFIYIKFIFF